MIEVLELLFVSGDLHNYFSELWQLAEKFHNSYEENAKITGWKTNNSCKVDFDKLPKKNLLTMLLTVSEIEQEEGKNSL